MDKLGSAIYLVLLNYFILSQLFAIYYWYEFAQNHGFLESLFIGPFAGELQGLLFPFFMLLVPFYI